MWLASPLLGWSNPPCTFTLSSQKKTNPTLRQQQPTGHLLSFRLCLSFNFHNSPLVANSIIQFYIWGNWSSVRSSNLIIIPKSSLVFFCNQFLSPSLSLVPSTNLLFFFRILCKWNHTVCTLCLASSEHVLEVHPFCWVSQQFFFYCWAVFPCSCS